MFSFFSKWVARVTGNPLTFSIALISIFIWLATGKYYQFSDTWQLVMNTITSIITFMMVFVIQNSQNRETNAIQVKLDELIRALEGAHNRILNIEDLSDKDIREIQKKYQAIAKAVEKETQDTGTPDIDR